MRFRIDLKIFLLIILFYFTKQIEVYAMTMCFVIIHELGHLLAGLLLGMKPQKMEIVPYGISISFKITPKDYNQKIKNGNLLEVKKIFVAIAGPLTNFIIILIAIKMKITIISTLMIIYSNCLLIAFNLLPIYPLDGGRILKGILYIIFGKVKAEKYINTISFISLICLTFIASIAIYKIQNIAIFLIILALWVIVIREDIFYKKRSKIYNVIEQYNKKSIKSIEIK